ncbi:MAG: hypothetical protein JXR86_07445 [Spirochaetales bacterium]|nr:hypothetical protein [Spirochaetales bacterium]
MTDRLYEFAGLDTFLENFRPETPEGCKAKAERKIYTDREELQKIYNRMELILPYLEQGKEKFDKIQYHLKRIPPINNRFVKGELRSELYSVKRLLHNYRAISRLLDRPVIEEFGFTYKADRVLDLLGYEDDEQESFFIKDSYSRELGSVRKSLRDVEKRLDELKKARIEEIRDLYALDFRFNDFLVVGESDVPPGSEMMLFLEPFDSSSVIVKPQLGREYHDTRNSAASLYLNEKELEEGILNRLAGEVEREREAIANCVISLTDLDLALARAKTALLYKCVKPVLSDEGAVSVAELRFIPLEEISRKESVSYTSLTADFDADHIVISGSNMGGKTVVLRTLLFAQLLAQMGFFVPAASFSSLIFRSFNLIGDKSGVAKIGLSSFGEEIMSLIRAEEKGNTLYVIDEFARTTNSIEAYALNSALLKAFSEKNNIRSFSSTHLENLPELENVSYWMMKGLDYLKYGEYFHSDFKGDLTERIRLINQYMDYRIEPRKAGERSSRDALKIADILGLDSRIVNYALINIKKQEKKNGE